jgi:hypothetical protein
MANGPQEPVLMADRSPPHSRIDDPARVVPQAEAKSPVGRWVDQHHADNTFVSIRGPQRLAALPTSVVLKLNFMEVPLINGFGTSDLHLLASDFKNLM